MLALKEELIKTSSFPWSDIGCWVAKATPVIRNDWLNFYEDFAEVAAEPRWISWPRGDPNSEMGRLMNLHTYEEERAARKAQAEYSKKQILSFLDGLLVASIPVAEDSALRKVLFLCERFSIFVRQLSSRERGRLPIEVKDEYDVQYLLLALLRLLFDDVRSEERTPSHAGGNAQMDFLLKEEKIVIETKMSRETLRDKQIGEELIIDIQKYAEHPDCNILICFIYDPNGFIENPPGLVRDLSGQKGKITVRVIISPAN